LAESSLGHMLNARDENLSIRGGIAKSFID
jgi:hypothetical protein